MRGFAGVCSLLVLASCCLAAEPLWRVQFFHDEDESTLVFKDIFFASSERGVAVGTTVFDNGRTKPVAMVTSDGGKTWSAVPLKEEPKSLYFLNENYGWLTTEEGVWFTEEAGRSWRKILKRRGLERAYFLTPEHGWAIGKPKLMVETKDGGKSWADVPGAARPESKSETTTYHTITFAAAKTGMVTGRSKPVRETEREFPEWMDPQRKQKAEWPSLSILLETKDAGVNWTPAVVSIFGRISEVQMARDGRGVALIEHEENFQYPSELVLLDWKTGKNAPMLRRKDRAVTDIAVLADGSAFAAGFEPTGSLIRSPVPGKLRILFSKDLASWSEMDADWRASAQRVAISALDRRHAWVCTDTGMILRLDAK